MRWSVLCAPVKKVSLGLEWVLWHVTRLHTAIHCLEHFLLTSTTCHVCKVLIPVELLTNILICSPLPFLPCISFFESASHLVTDKSNFYQKLIHFWHRMYNWLPVLLASCILSLSWNITWQSILPDQHPTKRERKSFSVSQTYYGQDNQLWHCCVQELYAIMWDLGWAKMTIPRRISKKRPLGTSCGTPFNFLRHPEV